MPTTDTRVTRARRSAPQRSFGPIADLEAHLPEEWWRQLFNALYVKTDGDVYENAENTRRDVDLLVSSTGIGQRSRVLDLCCGQGRHALELSRRGFVNVSGLDRSRYLVRLARKRASAEGLEVSFREGDARTPKLPADSFDCVCIMGNSFGYFSSKDDDEKVLRAVGRLLRPAGCLFLDVMDGEWGRNQFEPRSWEWIDEHQFVCRERSLSADGERLVSREVIVHDERGVIADQFYAERLYSVETLTELLEKAGFRNIRSSEPLEALSERDQDLGMMSRRLILTADAPEKPKKQSRGDTVLDVTVVLGDPRLADAVKRGGKFNEEDFETIRILKEALADLGDYRFRYLDNHATLCRDLSRLETDLVLNLCDEGFNNDPFKELHVPAVMEIYDLPYTGASPRCLSTCYDKGMVRAVANELDIPVPAESYIRPGDQAATLPSVFPALLKPNFGDSSEGITQDSVVRNKQELLAYLERLNTQFPNHPVLVQEFLSGAEYSVGILGNPKHGMTALPVLEVDYTALDPNLPRLLCYESKWHPDSPYWNDISYRQAELPDAEQGMLVSHSMRLFERLGCRDYARFDFRADASGTIKLLEVNPNPGWCWDGKQNLMAGFAGMSYGDLLAAILSAAVERLGVSARRKQPSAT